MRFPLSLDLVLGEISGRMPKGGREMVRFMGG